MPRRGVGWPPFHSTHAHLISSPPSFPIVPLPRPRLRSFPFFPLLSTHRRHDGGGRGLCRGRGGGHHLLAPRGRPRRVDAAVEGQRAAVVQSHGEGGDGLAGGGAGEADAVVALRLRGQQEQGEMGARQPRVSARLQRRVRLRRVHQRRRGRRLLLAAGHRRPRPRARRGHPDHRYPSFFLRGQGGLCRRSTAPVDPAGAAAAPHRRPEVAEEDEAPGGEAAGAVPVGGERRPSPGDGVSPEGLQGAVQGERQTRDKAGAFFLLQQAEECRGPRGGAATKEAAASRWRLRAPRPQLSGAGCRRRTSGGSLTAREPTPSPVAAPDG